MNRTGIAPASAIRPLASPHGIWLETGSAMATVFGMTFTEIKPQLDELNLEEKRKLEVYMRHTLRVETDENRQELSRRNRAMAAGKSYDLADVKAALARLNGGANAD